jgi:hypothetical protein
MQLLAEKNRAAILDFIKKTLMKLKNPWFFDILQYFQHLNAHEMAFGPTLSIEC